MERNYDYNSFQKQNSKTGRLESGLREAPGLRLRVKAVCPLHRAPAWLKYTVPPCVVSLVTCFSILLHSF